MITDEEIMRIALEHKNRDCFARAIYQLGRQHQRESDAELAKLRGDSGEVGYLGQGLNDFAEQVLTNTGELK